MTLLTLAGGTIGEWVRRVILALARPAPHSNRDVPPEFYKFPLF
jgi:hypothetical protein